MFSINLSKTGNEVIKTSPLETCANRVTWQIVKVTSAVVDQLIQAINLNSTQWGIKNHLIQSWSFRPPPPKFMIKGEGHIPFNRNVNHSYKGSIGLVKGHLFSLQIYSGNFWISLPRLLWYLYGLLILHCGYVKWLAIYQEGSDK